MFLNFAEQMLSKDQMKKVKGGCGSGVTCTVTCHFQGGPSYSYTGSCGAGSISACMNASPAGIGSNCNTSSCWNS